MTPTMDTKPTFPLKRTGQLLRTLMEAVRDTFFPEYGTLSEDEALRTVSQTLSTLCGEETAEEFMKELPSLKELLTEDVEAISRNDPAAESLQEIIYCYPAVTAMLHHRVAHQLSLQGVKVLPRMLAEYAHSQTGIDIHPEATIGHHFAIDHGTGIVIGQTAIIGNYVTLYQGVTVGARNFKYDENGLPRNIPRHPIIGDGVTVYSNASLLGRITIGEGSTIGGNVWLTHSVPPHSKVLQGRIQEQFSDGAGI